MSPSHVLEPTYLAIKARLMAGGWRPGARLEASRLADDFGVSVTPVRECLSRLAGERMLEIVPGDGFRVARLTEQRLRHLFAFNLHILVLALERASPGSFVDPGVEAKSDMPAAQLFSEIALGAQNDEIHETINSLNQRLHVVRMFDAQVIDAAAAELAALEQWWLLGNVAALRTGLTTYHERRIEKVARFIRRLEAGAAR